MSHSDHTANNIEPFFHPVSHYDSPDDVLNAVKLSTDEKRVILSSWASDMYVVESHPALRQVPGIPHQIRLHDILAALRRLDDDNDPPPRGGLAMRPPRFSKLDCELHQHFINRQAAPRRGRPLQASRIAGRSRWSREANVQRYRKLLNTQLSEIERAFVERQLR